MYTVTDTLKAAIESGAPQRVLLQFTRRPDGTPYSPNVYFSNENLNNGFELMEYFNSETDLTVGLCPSAEFKFAIFNDNYDWQDFEFGTFTAWLGAQIVSGVPSPEAKKTRTFSPPKHTEYLGVYEFTPLGTFIAEKPNLYRKKVVTVTANDRMILFDQNMPSGAELGLNYPFTLKTLLQAMCSYVGVSLRSSNFLNNNVQVTEEPEEFENSTMREVLGWIAEAGCSIARFNRDGKLELTWFNKIKKTFDEHDYTDFNPAYYEVKPIDKLTIRNGNSDGTFIAGTGGNAYVIQGNPFLKQGGGGGGTEIVIETQPVNRKGKENTNVTFSVIARNAITYRWMRSSDNGATWLAVPLNDTQARWRGADTSTMSVTVTTTTAKYKYKCKIENDSGTKETNTVTLTRVTS